jgi:hypothetical protein
MQALTNLLAVISDLSEVAGLDVIDVNRTHGTLEIDLTSRRLKKGFTVTAEKTVCVREFDEGDAMTYLPELRGGVYVCEKSDLLDWFAFSRSPLDAIHGLRHWILVSSDTVIEWLSTTEPTINTKEYSSEP